MKIKFVVIDFELSARAKRVAAAVMIPLTVLGGGAVAYAGVPHMWAEGDTLSAADLNKNFSELDERVTAIEAKTPTYLESLGTSPESAPFAADLVYQGMSVDLTPGTWDVQASAMLTGSINADLVQISLWDDTNNVEVPNSRSAGATTGSGGPCGAACNAVSLTTSRVITVAANTTIRLKAYRNGGSQVWVGSPSPAVVLPTGNRIAALQLR